MENNNEGRAATPVAGSGSTHDAWKRPIYYTDTINARQVCRDDLWAITTDELRALDSFAARASDSPQPVDAAQAMPDKAWESMCRKAVAVLNKHIVPDGISDHAALTELYGIFDSDEYRSTGTIEQDRCDQRQSEAMAIDRTVSTLSAAAVASTDTTKGA